MILNVAGYITVLADYREVGIGGIVVGLLLIVLSVCFYIHSLWKRIDEINDELDREALFAKCGGWIHDKPIVGKAFMMASGMVDMIGQSATPNPDGRRNLVEWARPIHAELPEEWKDRFGHPSHIPAMSSEAALAAERHRRMEVLKEFREWLKR